MINDFEGIPFQPINGALAIFAIGSAAQLLVYGGASIIYSYSNLLKYIQKQSSSNLDDAKKQKSKLGSRAIEVLRTLAGSFAIGSVINLCFNVISLYPKAESYFALAAFAKALTWVPVFRLAEYGLRTAELRYKYLYGNQNQKDSEQRTKEYQATKAKFWDKFKTTTIVSVICKTTLYYSEYAYKIASGYQWIGLAVCIEFMRQSAFYKWSPKIGKHAEKKQAQPWYNDLGGIVYTSAISELMFDHLALDLAPKILPKMAVDVNHIQPIAVVLNAISLTAVQSFVYNGLYKLETAMSTFLSKWRVRDYNHNKVQQVAQNYNKSDQAMAKKIG